MRALICAAALALAPLAASGAQGPDTVVQRLPREVRRQVVRLWNGPVALRGSGPTTIPAENTVEGNVAVEGGPLTIAGRVSGSVLAINGDVTLESTARIDGDVLVVGGRLAVNGATITGETRVYRDSLVYTRQNDVITVATDTGGGVEAWWRRWDRRRSQNWQRFQIASAGAYNRTEGLPIHLGPQVQRLTPWGSVRLDAYGVLRTATSFSGKDSDIGHTVRTEVQLGRNHGVSVGGQLFSVVTPVERWQLSEIEAALASFLFRRDYRDYYTRHGGRLFASAFAGPDVNITAGFSDERWSSRATNNPWTLFRNNDPWRPNPAMDEGRFHVATLELRLDTRNDVDRPWAGWYANADWERGAGRYSALGAGGPATGGVTTYQRAFVDLRRYNRVSPDAQLNFRVVAGGWIGGDPLPLERRLSTEGPDVLPGFDFRSPAAPNDVGTCSGTVPGPGLPAQCERIAVAQVEYRNQIHFGWGGDWDSDARALPARRPHMRLAGWRTDAAWVVFADAGRGWLVHDDAASVGSTAFGGSFPRFSSFRTDVGAGLDFGTIGVFVAKALSDPHEPANLVIRLRRSL